jgi:signal transduction histidine kinase
MISPDRGTAVSWSEFAIRAPASAEFRSATQTALIVFAAYLIGTEAAFLVGTLSDKIFAPFWPPNVILMAAMLLTGRQRIWLCILAALPAHVIAEARVGMPLSQMAVAFATNVAVATASAGVIWRFVGDPPWFETFRKAAIYVVLAGFACPAIVAFAGAFVPILGNAPGSYAEHWLQWFSANALGNLTLGPVAIIVAGEGMKALWPSQRVRQAEALIVICALLGATHIAFTAGAGRSSDLFLPSLLYLPLPLILWYTARFGTAGASISVLTVTIDLIWRALNGPSLFLGPTADTNVFALQIFLMCLAVPVLLLGASIDQTRQVERKLREDEERIGLAAAAAHVGFWQYDIAANRIWLSEYARTLFGLQDGIGIAIEQGELLALVHPDDAPLVRQIVLGKEYAKTEPIEFRAGSPGQTRWILARSHKLADAVAPKISGIFIDVTARKTAEAAFEQQQREIAHLMRVHQMGELSGGIAHEMTQPLTAILANAQAARLLLDSPQADLSLIGEVLDDIIREDQRAGEVIKRLRSLLKNSNAEFAPVDVNDLVNSTLELLRGESISRRTRIMSELEFGIPPITGDTVQLQQVLINLVMNAIEAAHEMDTGRRVIVLHTRDNGHGMVEISVKDQGIGISAADQKHVFKPFFTTKERGMGLGLSICSTIVTRHRGTLTIKSGLDEGTTAYLRLPVMGSQ